MQRWMNGINLSVKLYMIVLLAALALVISNALLINSSAKSAAELEQQLYGELYHATYYLLNADRDFYQTDQAMMGLLAGSEYTGKSEDELRRDLQDNAAQVLDRMELARKILITDDHLDQGDIQGYFEAFITGYEEWRSEALALFATSTASISAERIANLKQEFEVLRNLIDLIQMDLEDNAVETVAAIQAANRTSTIYSTILSAVLLLIVCGASYVLISSITKPIKRLVGVQTQIAQGNLNVDMSKQNADRKDEIGQLLASSDQMVQRLRMMVQQIQSISANVRLQSDRLTQSAGEVTKGAEQVASAMIELSSVSEEQAGASSEIAVIMETLNGKIGTSHELGETMYAESQQVRERAKAGEHDMDDSVRLMEEVTSLVVQSADQVHDLRRRSEDISRLVIVIRDIAQQTNLLALNAAIEAARAGEAGQGFAVVAGEVRKLADQVERSIAEITSIINGFLGETQLMAEALESGAAIAQQSNQQIRISRDSFGAITASVSDMLKHLQTITEHMQEITEDSDKVSHTVSDIAAASQQSAAGIEESSAISQQQSASMQEINGHAETLSKLSAEMDQLIQQFKV